MLAALHRMVIQSLTNGRRINHHRVADGLFYDHWNKPSSCCCLETCRFDRCGGSTGALHNPSTSVR